MISVVREYVKFSSVLDIGCGVGQMLRAYHDSGVNIIRGVDGSWVNPELLLIPKECFTHYDLSHPNLKDAIHEQHFDLTISSEVAEHIDPKDADSFMDNLTSFSEVVLFSAAIPGQGGTHHVNEQWPSYWIEKFAARGYVPIDCIRPNIWDDENMRIDYRQNLLLFVKQDSLSKYPALTSEVSKKVLSLVHPEFLKMKLNAAKLSNKGFLTLCKIILTAAFYLIPAFIRAVKKRIMP